jgi:hypothetical protein
VRIRAKRASIVERVLEQSDRDDLTLFVAIPSYGTLRNARNTLKRRVTNRSGMCEDYKAIAFQKEFKTLEDPSRVAL